MVENRGKEIFKIGKIVEKYLYTLVVSVNSERVFSTTENIVNSRRTSSTTGKCRLISAQRQLTSNNYFVVLLFIAGT